MYLFDTTRQYKFQYSVLLIYIDILLGSIHSNIPCSLFVLTCGIHVLHRVDELKIITEEELVNEAFEVAFKV